ncbi:MAG: hypothetical protein AAF989_06265, partial [Planctomycetota bacterium]
NHLLQVAVAQPREEGGFDVMVDSIRCRLLTGWLHADGYDDLVESLRTLIDRNQMRRQSVVASLDGDFCVTRITMGSPGDVDDELETLIGRVPRYLQLGPGEKVTGACRTHLEANLDYAITGVANRNVIELLYEAFRECDLPVKWLEPSLNSLARLLGHAGIGNDMPVLIADGTGRMWDVGIAHEGRLLLDYRPAAATTEQGFHDAIRHHLDRLCRFCQRHRRLASGGLNQLLLCGTVESSARAVELFSESDGIEASPIHVPEIDGLYRVVDPGESGDGSSVVATVLPLILGLDETDVPDLLDHVRRAPDLSPTARVLRTFWPAVAAVAFLMGSYFLVSHQRNNSQDVITGRTAIEHQVRLSQVRMSQLAGHRELIDHLTSIETRLEQPAWDDFLRQVTQCLPEQAHLISFRVENGFKVALDGAVTEESRVYDLIGHLRKLPVVEQVALKATNPDSQSEGVRFMIGLTVASNLNTPADRAGLE